MNKKVITVLFCLFLAVAIDIFCFDLLGKNEGFIRFSDIYSDNIKYVSKIANKFSISPTGEVEVTANYKGAHGENYPAVFNYNYELSDKLYFENEEYSSINIDKYLLKNIEVLKKIQDIDINNYSRKISKHNKYRIMYDSSYINEVLNTNFKEVYVDINLSGLIKKIDSVDIYLDDIKINYCNKEFKINYGKYNIVVALTNSASYANVNNKLKMNVFTSDNISFSIVFNNQVYSLELVDNGMNIKFVTKAAIYNSLDIKVRNSDVRLDKLVETIDYNDNPIIRYLSESNLSLE